jgi:undecaprenyl-diphosphatase
LNFFESLVTPSLTQFAIIISDFLGKNYVLLGTASVLLLYLGAKRDWHACLIFISLMLLTIISIIIFKHLSDSIRPNVVKLAPSTYSFPSGHTLFSFIIFSYIGFLIGHVTTKTWVKKLTYWVVGIIISLVFLSRLILKIHWLSDVIGSLLLGSAFICLFIIAYRRKERYNRFSIWPLILLTILGQGIFGTAYYLHTRHNDTKNYQLRHTSNYVNPSVWWRATHSVLPVYRYSRLNKPVQILNIQWLADLESIERRLKKQGWQIAPRFGLHTIKQQLMGQALVLSPFTQQFKHHTPVLVMTKKLSQKDSYLILRLWDGNYHTPVESIYVGNISYHLPVQHWLWNRKKICPNSKRDIFQELTKVLPYSNWKTLSFKQKYTIKHNPCIHEENKILLIKANSY